MAKFERIIKKEPHGSSAEPSMRCRGNGVAPIPAVLSQFAQPAHFRKAAKNAWYVSGVSSSSLTAAIAVWRSRLARKANWNRSVSFPMVASGGRAFMVASNMALSMV